MSEEKNQVENQTDVEESAQGQAAELTVQDLNALKQIIDVASQRGTFKPNEMMTVGQVYNKLDTFLAAVAQSQQQAEQSQGE